MKVGSVVRGLALIPLLASLGTGCNDNTKIAPPPVSDGYLAQSSPENALRNLVTAYQARKIDAYSRLFSSDFVFVFSPLDVHDPDDPTPATWSLDEERLSATHMFADSLVESIQLDLLPGTAEPADSATYGPRAWKVKVDNAILHVSTRNETGEPLTYLVPGTTEVFYLREDPTRPASDGLPGYYIFRWEDKPIGAIKTERTTWGQVKWIFHQ